MRGNRDFGCPVLNKNVLHCTVQFWRKTIFDCQIWNKALPHYTVLAVTYITNYCHLCHFCHYSIVYWCKKKKNSSSVTTQFTLSTLNTNFIIPFIITVITATTLNTLLNHCSLRPAIILMKTLGIINWNINAYFKSVDLWSKQKWNLRKTEN